MEAGLQSVAYEDLPIDESVDDRAQDGKQLLDAGRLLLEKVGLKALVDYLRREGTRIVVKEGHLGLA